MYAKNTEVTLKDNQFWTARPVHIVMETRVHEGREQYRLRPMYVLEVSDEWVDASLVDGPPEIPS